jgi:hypothetical protein
VHAPDRSRLGVVAQHAKFGLIHHDHRRDPGIAGNGPRFVRAADCLSARVRREQREREEEG